MLLMTNVFINLNKGIRELGLLGSCKTYYQHLIGLVYRVDEKEQVKRIKEEITLSYANYMTWVYMNEQTNNEKGEVYQEFKDQLGSSQEKCYEV